MPKRTNLFQETVDMIQRIVAPDSIVESSALLFDRLTGRTREVDVVVRSIVDGEQQVISVEATSIGRRATVPWVDAHHAKHLRLETTQLVLVSEAGFAATARDLARKLGHLTVDPSDDLDLLDKDFLFVGQPGTIIIRDVEPGPEIALAVAALDAFGATIQVDANLETMLVQGDGTPLLSVSEFLAEKWEANIEELRRRVGDFSEESTRKGFEFRFVLPSSGDEDLYLVVGEDLLRVNLVFFRGTVEYRDQEVEMKHGVLFGKAVSYGAITLPGRAGVIVGTDASGEERLHIRSLEREEPPRGEGGDTGDLAQFT